MRPIAVLAVVALVAVAGISGYVAGNGAGRSSTSTLTSISTTTVTAATPSLTNASTTSSSSTTATSTFATQPESYTVNGLTCPFWEGMSQNVISLVQNITRDSRFLNATHDGQFTLGNYENITDGIQIIGGNRTVAGTTIHLPDVIELVFYGSESGTTTCQRSANQYVNVVVHVPIQGGGFNMTGADFHCGPSRPVVPFHN